MSTRPHSGALAAAVAVLALAGCDPKHSTQPHSELARFRATSALRQTGRPGELVGSRPTVMVVDAGGAPVPGATVLFEVQGGGGTVSSASAVSGANGLVATDWRLGASGAQTLQATLQDPPAAAVRFAADLVVGAGYHVDLRLYTAATDTQWAAFRSAGTRIEGLMAAALPATSLAGKSCNGIPLSGTTEGILIAVRIENIDGRGGVLGEAGPCAWRASSGLPAAGFMRFDTSDLVALETNGRLVDTVLHEMLHVVGFGLWARDPTLVSGIGTLDSAFKGPEALAAAKGYNGAPDSWTTVPLENCGPDSPRGCGGGTRDSHWREPVFGAELMTGWLSPGPAPLSRTTIAALQDLGYTVNLDAADPFDLGLAALLSAEGAAPDAIPLGEDVLHLPIELVP